VEEHAIKGGDDRVCQGIGGVNGVGIPVIQEFGELGDGLVAVAAVPVAVAEVIGVGVGWTRGIGGWIHCVLIVDVIGVGRRGGARGAPRKGKRGHLVMKVIFLLGWIKI
jgi:hypothetical protein